MKKFEYRIIIHPPLNIDDPDPPTLNVMGQEGWELVAVTSQLEARRFYFKRPLPSLDGWFG